MKKIISLLLLMSWLTVAVHSQAIHIFHDNKTKADVYVNAEVDSIKINPISKGTDKYEYALHTTTGVVKYDIGTVDSIKFNLPYLKLMPRKGKCQIPNDGLMWVVNYVYSSSDQPPVMRFPDGKEIQGEVIAQGEEDSLYGFTLNAQELYETRDGKSEEKWYIVDGERIDSLCVEFTGLSTFDTQWHEVGISSEATEFKLRPHVDNVELGNIYGIRPSDAGWDYDWADWEYNMDGDIVIKFSKNETSEKRELYITPHTEYTDCLWVLGQFVQLPAFKHTSDEHMQALRDFYNSTSLKDLETNWFSDAPLWEWDFSVNNHLWSNFYWHINDHVVNLYTGGGQYTGITGTLPPSFEVLMEDVYGNGELDLTQCALYGTIPQNVKDNPSWKEFGWNILQQMVWFGGGFDLEGHSNLYLDNSEVEDFVTGQSTNVYDVLSENKITWVFNGGAVDMIGGISDERVNKYLDYRDKGFGLVVTVGGYWDTPYDDYRDYVLNEREHNRLPADILWTKGFDKAPMGPYGSMCLIDDKGELIWYREYDGFMSDNYYLDQIDEVCRKYFGEPSDHPLYVSNVYESTDFSHDGEVMVLQEARIGNGIPLVFTGDKFIDKDFEDGVFESQMYEAMEQFFSIEPYASLRDRFNVYAVKAVSVNDYRGSNHVFNNDDMRVMEYVGKIPDIDLDNVTVGVIEYDPNYSFFVSGYASLLESGASISYMQQGNASEVIRHETGGHGFAKLLDEYIFDEAQDNRLSGEDLMTFKEFIKTYYHDREWGMNVATTDNPDEVPWQRFLKDPRYENEVGVYQGAWLYPYDLWRPTETSIMKETNESEFNAPAREAIYKRVMKLSEEDWIYDYETFVEFDQQCRLHERQTRANTNVTSRPIIHQSPKLRRVVDGKIEDIPIPFGHKSSTRGDVPAKKNIPHIKRDGKHIGKHDRVIIKKGEIFQLD